MTVSHSSAATLATNVSTTSGAPAVRRYLVPTLGRTKLIELRPHHLDSLYGDLINGRIPGATAITVHHVHRTLRSALNSAVKRRLIPWNPALHVELPQRLPAATQVWNPEDVRRFLDASADHQFGLVFHVIAFTGMRRGESLGLHWTDVHPEGPHLVVRCQIVNAAHGPALGLPKTRAGARVVPIDTFTSQLLEEHRKLQVLQQSAWGDDWADTGLVFTREDGAMVAPDRASQAFKQIVKRAGLPRIRLHDLRHTTASQYRRGRRHQGRQRPLGALHHSDHQRPLHPRDSDRRAGGCQRHRGHYPAGREAHS